MKGGAENKDRIPPRANWPPRCPVVRYAAWTLRDNVLCLPRGGICPATNCGFVAGGAVTARRRYSGNFKLGRFFFTKVFAI